MNNIRESFEGHPPDRDLVHIPAGMPATHLLPGVTDTLREVGDVTCQLGGLRYRYVNGVLTFLSAGGAQVEVAPVVDNILVEVNDVVVATDITNSNQVEHERLREVVEASFRVFNGLAAAVEQQRLDAIRLEEQAVQRALDSL